MKNKIIFTVDLEFWYNSEFLKNGLKKNCLAQNDFITESVGPLLKLLKKYKIKATFFVLGEVAEKYPDLIYKISKEDHEIASHGYSHKTLKKLGRKQFEEQIVKSKKLIEKIIHHRLLEFRAPNSISQINRANFLNFPPLSSDKEI